MMKILATTVFLLFAISCYSQITTIAMEEKKEKEVVLKYDSLESLNCDNVLLHLGQTLFLKGNSYTKEHGFSYHFFTEMLTDTVIDRERYAYKPIELPDPQSTGNTHIVSDYSALVGKYYKVISVETEEPSHWATTYWLKLVGEDNIPFYYTFDKFGGWKYFVTLGYYEKMKQTFVGKEFYSKGRYELDKVDVKEKVTPPFKVKFKCTDITVNVGEDGPIFAVMENEKYGKIKGVIIKGTKLDNFISVASYNQYVKKYGPKYGSWVAEGKIELGMNKKMVLDAWGAPQKVNTTQGVNGVEEQWVYNDRYLYFKNGILTYTQL